MILEHVPDPDGNQIITDTDTLNDVPAALLEAAEKFRLECIKYKRQFFLAVNADDDVRGTGHTFWSFVSEKMTPPEDDNLKEKRMLTAQEGNALYSMIARGVYGLSGGRFLVVGVPMTDDPGKNKNDGQGTTGENKGS
jgi:hypothetical protein